MEKINKKIGRYEFTAVYTHQKAKADIVLVHGLNGHPQRTWTAANGVFWPADLLPASLKNEHANVLVYGYNADVYSTKRDRSPSDNFIHQHAQTLVTSLTQFRKSQGTERNPIIWVAHSLGGILTKRALLYSNDVLARQQEDFRSVFVSTYGIVFLGTPHTGSDIATWGRMLQQMSDVVVPRTFFQTESVLLKTLKKDNETLQSINSHFLDVYQRFRIHMAHENHTTDLKGTKVFVVDATSASPQLPGVVYYGIEATHSGMCKFESESAPGYVNVSTAIREWVAGSPEVIEVRWEVEEDERRLRADLANYESSRLYHRTLPPNTATPHHELVEGNNETPLYESPTETASPLLLPPVEAEGTAMAQRADQRAEPRVDQRPILESQFRDEPLFIRPESFRPNSFFMGREDELRGLHEMLMDRKRRSEGTSAVLIQCLPGGGKTHLAREYVFRHKNDYPGGVYWVRAKSLHEMEYWFWRIARNEALKGLVEQQDLHQLGDPKRIVEIVRKWLNTQSDWLMVLDGVQFDIPGLHEFIPDAKHTSLIYTSTERAVTGDPRFDNPQVMELGLLTSQQAQDLLLLEMDKKKPWSADDQEKAHDLVQLMGRLPLMIHVAAQHLKATREPLARYLKSYKSRPKAGGLPAYKAVRDQLEHRGANAALNLISILVFFDQHIPVEMLTLGLTALDNITPVKTCNPSHRRTNLSNTLRILIAFALIERTESDDISPTSSRSSKKSLDKHVDYLDLLRIHSVVQDFFIDSLNRQKQVHFWLDRATAVWCRSYDEAHKRILEDPRVGLPDDYRRFLIHGQRLLQNLQRFERKAPELLAAAQQAVTDRLVKIQSQIDQLSHDIQTSIIDGLGVVSPASVFERSSTMSETDSTATVSNHESQNSSGWGQFTGSGDDDGSEPLQSPSAYDAVLATPPRWPIPYPNRVLMPPSPNLDDDDDEGTAIPPATMTPTMPARDGNISPASGRDVSNSLMWDDYEAWQEVIPHHRVIKRNELRRYHDRAGAWRDRSVGDPRVGLTLQVASGSVQSRGGSSRSSSRNRLTARSDAEMELNKLKQAALAQAGPEAVNTSTTRTQTHTQPQPIPGNRIDQSPPTELGTSPAESLGGLARLITSPTGWKTALKKIRNNLSTSPKQSAEQSSPTLPPSALRQSQLPPEDQILVPPGPIFRGSRTANSSPGTTSSPFPAPTFPAADTISTDEYLQTGLPVEVRRWGTDEPPILGRFGESPEQSWSADPMSISYPAPTRGRDPYQPKAPLRGRGTPAQTNHQPLTGSQMWMPAPPSGYTSQPMSRDPSHQSMSSGQGQQQASISPNGSPGSSTRQQRISPPGAPQNSSPLAVSDTPNIPSPIAIASSQQRPIPTFRNRRSSITETEPSPRLDSAFPDVDTSYQRYTRKNTGPSSSNDHFGRSFPPIGESNSNTPPLGQVPPRWQRLNRGRGRGTRTASRGRSQSLSPSPSSTSRLNQQRPLAYSPQLLPPQQMSPELRGIAGGGGGGGGEPMARSSSGSSGASPIEHGTTATRKPPAVGAGIRLSDGRVVEFSHLQGQVAAAGRRGSIPSTSSPLSGTRLGGGGGTTSFNGSGSGSPTTSGGNFGLGISQ